MFVSNAWDALYRFQFGNTWFLVFIVQVILIFVSNACNSVCKFQFGRLASEHPLHTHHDLESATPNL